MPYVIQNPDEEYYVGQKPVVSASDSPNHVPTFESLDHEDPIAGGALSYETRPEAVEVILGLNALGITDLAPVEI